VCAPYNVLLSRSARRELKRLQKLLESERFKRLDEKIRDLANDPRPPASEDFKGEENAYRLRDGDCRVIYCVDDVSRQVKVGKIGHRRDVYRH
jgi:mRNA interferase RelE/StbE